MRQAWESQPEDTRQREFRRMLGFSMVAHVALLVLAVAIPSPGAIAPGAEFISVELVAAASLPSPAAPAPTRAAPPPPPPPPKRPQKVVLPERPRAAEPQPAAKPRQKPRRREVVLEPRPREQQGLDDLLAQFREEQGEPTPEPPEAPPQVASVEPSPAGSTKISLEEAAWRKRVRIHVKGNWAGAAGFSMQLLSTTVVLQLDDSGKVRTYRVSKPSDSYHYDEAVKRTLEKSNPLPAPPSPGKWTFRFDSGDFF